MDENNDIISELLKAQKEIISGVYKVQYFDNNMKKYGLLNSDWIEKNMDSLTGQNFYLNDDECLPKEENRDYSFIDDYSNISIPVNFTFVTEDFMSLLSEKFFYENIKYKIKNYYVEILIGEECIIMMDRQQRYQYSYIILYVPKTENINKNIDYILKITDQLELNKARDFILKNNIWNYMKKINFSYEDEYKDILSKNNEKIGYLARNNYSNNNLKLIEKQRLGTLDNENNFINDMNNINNIFNFNMIDINNMNNFNNNNFMKQMINMNNMINTNYMGNLNYMNCMINNNNMNNSTNSNNNINNNPNNNYNNIMNSNINYNNMMNGNMNLTNNNNMNNNIVNFNNMNNSNMNNNIMNCNNMNCNNMNNNNMNNNIMNCNNMNNNMNNSNMNNNMNNSNMNSNIMMNFNMNNASNNNIMNIMNKMNNMNNSNMNSNNMNLTNINNNVKGQINSNMNYNTFNNNINNICKNNMNFNNNMSYINNNNFNANNNLNMINSFNINNNQYSNNFNFVSCSNMINKSMSGNNNNSKVNSVFITFTYEPNNKQVFIDSKDNETFLDVINLLENKYNWLKKIQNKFYFYENKEIQSNQMNIRIKDLGIKDNSSIIIKDRNY